MTRAMAKYVAEICARTVLPDLNYCVNHRGDEQELALDLKRIRICLFEALLGFPAQLKPDIDSTWRSPLADAWNKLNEARRFRPQCPVRIAYALQILTAINAHIATN